VKTVAILGTHPRTRDMAPWDDPKIDIWVQNEAGNQSFVKRCNAVFQLHVPAIYMNPHNRCDPKHWEWLQQKHDGLSIYMQALDPLVPDSEQYPLESLISILGCERFFTSTTDYMIALAIYLDYERIDLYGIEMETNTEYNQQQDSFMYWYGFAQGYGVKVIRHCADWMFSKPLYGYEGIVKQDTAQYEQRIKELIEESRSWEKKIEQIGNRIEHGLEDGNLDGNISDLLQANIQKGQIDGGISELKRYLEKIKAMEAVGGLGILTGNEFESASVRARKDYEQFSAEVHRTAGRMDYMFEVWNQSKDRRALQNIQQLMKMHMDAGYKSGQAQGISNTNKVLAQEITNREHAIGGERAIDMMKAEVING